MHLSESMVADMLIGYMSMLLFQIYLSLLMCIVTGLMLVKLQTTDQTPPHTFVINCDLVSISV